VLNQASVRFCWLMQFAQTLTARGSVKLGKTTREPDVALAVIVLPNRVVLKLSI